jgi:hypothetical protein
MEHTRNLAYYLCAKNFLWIEQKGKKIKYDENCDNRVSGPIRLRLRGEEDGKDGFVPSKRDKREELHNRLTTKEEKQEKE